ncbi:MAG: MFS transporter [Atopobiaceae bacterium]|nr:MFS transporter [Atopobiaceae bacterium]
MVIFLNGFESGGYQASLLSIGESYGLSMTSMGLYAALELFADMLAPLLLGRWADRVGKRLSIAVALVLQALCCVELLLAPSREFFLAGMFLLGITTSTLQFVTIAALADAYPASKERRIGYITSMYAFGAVISPLAVSLYLGLGLSWKALFVLLGIGTIVSLVGIHSCGLHPREQIPAHRGPKYAAGAFVLAGVLTFCVVMCVYVGYENGFAFFVDTLFATELNSSTGKFALSLYWAAMIPARALVGHHAKHTYRILLACIIAIPCASALIAAANSSALVMLLCIPLGLASGAIYPCSLSLSLSFAGNKTATATGMITTATGIGGFALTALAGFLADACGMRMTLLIMAAFFVLPLAALLHMQRDPQLRSATRN